MTFFVQNHSDCKVVFEGRILPALEFAKKQSEETHDEFGVYSGKLVAYFYNGKLENVGKVKVKDIMKGE